MAAGVNGSTVLLQFRTGTGPDVYTTVAGQQGMSISRERTMIETSAKEDADATFAAGRRSSTVSLDGLYLAADVTRTSVEAWFDGSGAVVGRIRRTAIGAEAAKQADVLVSSLEAEFPDDDASTWTAEFQVTGAWTAIS
ncbi:MAG: phage tail protein [Chloroflexi bacterium]|nr:phage tail protein [Chloroflexota bacterium]